ncbi:ribosomal protein S18-alanine N-acetyltransferase [Alteromonas aestuariivivens]|uniref:ribosomal protein S18-alanine N-acetyltransferase n=1 Tax=Alteromonas aestuariivivens TaxID=1938339 RepID=UPI0015F26EB7|nr:ribosomal protein S18-alanine N-acetyltransferase [Alteromonas aestuariivivens]
MSIVVRPATPDEVHQAYQLHCEAVFRPWSKTTFEDCTTPPYELLVAESGETFIGYAVVLKVADEATLMDIAVLPQARGQGAGQKLLEALLSDCNHSMASVWLEVRSGNLVAQRLYHRHGFVVQEVRKGYYPCADGTEDAVIMVKWLNKEST